MTPLFKPKRFKEVAARDWWQVEAQVDIDLPAYGITLPRYTTLKGLHTKGEAQDICNAFQKAWDAERLARQASPATVSHIVTTAAGEVVDEGFSFQCGAHVYRLHEADSAFVYVRRRRDSGEWGKVVKRRPAALGLRLAPGVAR